MLKSAPIVAECEWGTLGAVKDDFEKLLLARATVRVMVFNGMYREIGTEAFANKICGWVGAFEGNQKGDTYLLVGYEEMKTRTGASGISKSLLTTLVNSPYPKGYSNRPQGAR